MNRIFLWLMVLIALTIIAVISFNVMMDRFFAAVVEGKNGHVTDAGEWPRPLKELAARAAKQKVRVEYLKVHCIANGWVTEYVWRMRSTPGMFELMRDEFELYADENQKERIPFPGSPAWWDPQDIKDAKCFLGRSSNIGDKGDKFWVCHDEPLECIYVYYNDNW